MIRLPSSQGCRRGVCLHTSVASISLASWATKAGKWETQSRLEKNVLIAECSSWCHRFIYVDATERVISKRSIHSVHPPPYTHTRTHRKAQCLHVTCVYVRLGGDSSCTLFFFSFHEDVDAADARSWPASFVVFDQIDTVA